MCVLVDTAFAIGINSLLCLRWRALATNNDDIVAFVVVVFAAVDYGDDEQISPSVFAIFFCSIFSHSIFIHLSSVGVRVEIISDCATLFTLDCVRNDAERVHVNDDDRWISSIFSLFFRFWVFVPWHWRVPPTDWWMILMIMIIVMKMNARVYYDYLHGCAATHSNSHRSRWWLFNWEASSDDDFAVGTFLACVGI